MGMAIRFFFVIDIFVSKIFKLDKIYRHDFISWYDYGTQIIWWWSPLPTFPFNLNRGSITKSNLRQLKLILLMCYMHLTFPNWKKNSMLHAFPVTMISSTKFTGIYQTKYFIQLYSFTILYTNSLFDFCSLYHETVWEVRKHQWTKLRRTLASYETQDYKYNL